MVMMNDQRSKAKGRGRGRGACPGAGGDSQTSTLNAEAPEFQPPVRLMEHMHLDQAHRYPPHQGSYSTHQQNMHQPMPYSRAVGGGAQPGDAAKLAQATVVRIRNREKVQDASESLVSFLNSTKGVEEMIAIAKCLMAFGENEDRHKTESIFQLIVHLSDKFCQPARSFSQLMLRELSERLMQWHRTCASNSGFVAQCVPFLTMLGQLYPTLAHIALAQVSISLGLAIVSFLRVLLQSDNSDGHHQMLQVLYQVGPTLQDIMVSDRDGQASDANNGAGGSGSQLEDLYQQIRVCIVRKQFASSEIALNFIVLLEYRGSNWGRLFQRQASAEAGGGGNSGGGGGGGGGVSRQNSEAMMDDDMYECYERFLAETGQI